MTALGWTFMVLSLSFVVGLVVWCYAKVLRLPPDNNGG